MVRKYIKAFLNIPMFVAGVTTGAIYIYFLLNPTRGRISESLSLAVSLPVLWITIFINEPILSKERENIEDKQMLNTLPLGSVIISKMRLVQYLTALVVLILMLVFKIIGAFALLSNLVSNLIASLSLDNKDTVPTKIQEFIASSTSFAYLLLTWIFITFKEFNGLQRILYPLLLFIPLIIYAFYFMKYKEKRRWRDG